MSYGKIIPNLKIHGIVAPYPVINEREVRGAAGLMFLMGIIAFFITFFTGTSTLLYVAVPIFWFEFFLKSVFQPHYSMFGFVARYIVQKQAPEYVGVIQKRFAWSLGLGLATVMMLVVFVFGMRGALPMTICLTCLSLMWLESSFGICVGCKMYSFLIKKGIIKKPDIKPACPGNVCAVE